MQEAGSGEDSARWPRPACQHLSQGSRKTRVRVSQSCRPTFGGPDSFRWLHPAAKGCGMRKRGTRQMLPATAVCSGGEHVPRLPCQGADSEDDDNVPFLQGNLQCSPPQTRLGERNLFNPPATFPKCTFHQHCPGRDTLISCCPVLCFAVLYSSMSSKL